jgi:DNA-binding CsgD family transcriptional regulator
VAGAPALKGALRAFRQERLSDEEELRWLWLACHIARALCDDDAWDALTARQLDLARRSGAYSLLPVALDDRLIVDLFAGRTGVASALAAEADAVIDATGSNLSLHGPITLANWRGRDAEVHTLIETRRQDVSRRGEGLWLREDDWSTAVLYNAMGRYGHALAAAERAVEDPRGMGVAPWMLSELIEAATRSGQPDRATAPLERLEEVAAASGTDFALAILARSRALVSKGEAAEELYRDAIRRLGRTRLRVALARVHLLYGEWLRREGRRLDARESLAIAYEMLAEMGWEAFAERARRELVATGQTVRQRSVDALDDMTAQEAQIARLAAAGQTNPQIGAQLFLSPRTVEWHLRKVYGKLGVASRRELSSVLPESAQLS